MLGLVCADKIFAEKIHSRENVFLKSIRRVSVSKISCFCMLAFFERKVRHLLSLS
jgi:hypothetical protein